MVSYQRNPHFTGRDELLTHLREKLLERKPKQYNHRIAIYGMGGVGKSQIAIEYVYRYQANYRAIFWLTASDQAALLSGFQEIGALTRCTSALINVNPTEAAQAVLRWLREQEGWLFIIDNLDDISVAKGYLPIIHGGGHTLITTRNPDATKIPAEGFQIPVLGEDAAIELLCVRSKIEFGESSAEKTHATELVRELGYLALAIEQVSGLIRSSVYTIEQFLQTYRKSRKRILLRKPDGNDPYRNSVAATFLLSVDAVKKLDYGVQALEILSLLVFLNPDGILIDFIQAGRQGLSIELQRTVEDDFTLSEALKALQKFSLIEILQKRQSIVTHRLIQAVVKDNMFDAEVDMHRHEIIEMFKAAFPETYDTREDRDLCRRFQNQVVEPLVQASRVQSLEASFLLAKVGRFLSYDGKYVDGGRLFTLSLDICRTSIGCEHPYTLTSMGNLATTYLRQGKLNEAAELQEKVLKARKTIPGEDHPDTLTSMDNLAVTYSRQGKLNEAAELQEKVRKATKTILGEDHPDTLTSMNNLASTYLRQGKLNEATELQQKVLEAWKTILGENHPDTLTSMSNLATTYWRQGKLNEAAELQKKVQEASKTILGEDHPDTLTSMGNLACSYKGLMRMSEALCLLRLAVAGSERSLGKNHPDTVARKAGLKSWIGGLPFSLSYS